MKKGSQIVKNINKWNQSHLREFIKVTGGNLCTFNSVPKKFIGNFKNLCLKPRLINL